VLVQTKYLNIFLKQLEFDMKGMKKKEPVGYMGGGELMNPNKGMNKVKAMKEGGEATVARGSGAARPQAFRKNG
jgi:hypothetical protein